MAGEGIAKQVTALKSAGKMMDARMKWNGFFFGVILRKGGKFSDETFMVRATHYTRSRISPVPFSAPWFE
jgi:hypothetical protein